MSNSPLSLFNTAIIDAESMASDITSDALDVKEVVNLAVQAVWTGSTPVGTLHIKGSCDGENFTDVSGGSTAVSGNTGSILLNIAGCGFSHLQIFYDATSGTGTLTVRVNAKRV